MLNNKYLNNLTTNEIRKIEAITYPLMNLLNYKFESDVSKQKKLNFIEEFIFKIHDFLTSYIFHIKDKGLRNGLLYLRRLKKSKIFKNSPKKVIFLLKGKKKPGFPFVFVFCSASEFLFLAVPPTSSPPAVSTS